MSDSLRPHELQHGRPPCPSPTPRVHSDSCPSSQWCHPAISFSVIPFSSCPQSFPASGSFPVSQLFASGSQSIRVSASASVLPMNIQDWSPLGWTGWISLQSKGLSKVFSNTTVQKHPGKLALDFHIPFPSFSFLIGLNFILSSKVLMPWPPQWKVTFRGPEISLLFKGYVGLLWCSVVQGSQCRGCGFNPWLRN